MQFALLGEIQFELITYFDGLEGRFGSDYAEHALIEGKRRGRIVVDVNRRVLRKNKGLPGDLPPGQAASLRHPGLRAQR